MKSKREILQGLVGNRNVVITAIDGRCIVRVVSDPTYFSTSTIDEVGAEMIHYVQNRRPSGQGWIDILSISEIEIEPLK